MSGYICYSCMVAHNNSHEIFLTIMRMMAKSAAKINIWIDNYILLFLLALVWQILTELFMGPRANILNDARIGWLRPNFWNILNILF